MIPSAKNHIKERLVKLLIKLLEEQKTKDWLDTHLSNPINFPKELYTAKHPYPGQTISNSAPTKDANKPIIISGRFRSGSTLLWNIFRNIETCTAYYEPFNERQWFKQEFRGNLVDTSHRGVDNYWSEYDGLQQLSKYYQENWIRQRLLMHETDTDPNMFSFVNYIITNTKNRPVLQFNRIDFRLAWFKANFPDCHYIHLYRNPRDQWCSFLTDIKNMPAANIEQSYKDNFYLNSWCDDLQTYFPFLSRAETSHPYERFYMLWVVSYLFGRYYSDYSLSFEELTEQPLDNIKKLLSFVSIETDRSETLSQILSPPRMDRWKEYAAENWFEEHESAAKEKLKRWGYELD